MTDTTTGTAARPLIFEAIHKIMADIGAIGKDQRNPQQGYNFRGIDDVYNTLHPLMVKYGVFVTPRVTEKTERTETTARGSKLFFVGLLVEHTFYAADGSHVVATTYGEGMDSGDKAGNKAMSAAMKYALIETFCIPTAGALDSETDSHDVAAPNHRPPTGQQQRQAPPPQQQRQAPAPRQQQAHQGNAGGGQGGHIRAAIVSVDTRQAQGKDGRQYTVYGINTSQGRFGTIDDNLGQQAQQMAGTGEEVGITFANDPRGRRMVDLTRPGVATDIHGNQDDNPPF